MQLTRPPVLFKRPPVMEVACAIAFALPKPLKSAHFGLYWSRVRDAFPRCEDAAPVPLIVESTAAADTTAFNLQVEMLNMPELRRTWLLTESGTTLLQLQGDRFMFNWKRTEQDPDYPSYKYVIAEFRKQWSRYKDFLAELDLGSPQPTQLELTYFNMIPGPRLLRDHKYEAADSRFLSEPEAINLRAQYPFPEGAGRLHVAAASARHVSTGKVGVRLDLNARGLPKDQSAAACDAWFDMAHYWITQGFADITTPEAHAEWEKE